MTGTGAAATAGVLTGASGIIAALTQSLLPLVVVGGLAFVVVITFVVVVLTAARAADPVRHAQATAVLDRLLLAIPGTRPVPPGLAALPLASAASRGRSHPDRRPRASLRPRRPEHRRRARPGTR